MGYLFPHKLNTRPGVGFWEEFPFFHARYGRSSLQEGHLGFLTSIATQKEILQLSLGLLFAGVLL